MIRIYLVLAFAACVVLVVLAGARGAVATTARWIAAAYLVAAAVLLVLGIGL